MPIKNDSYGSMKGSDVNSIDAGDSNKFTVKFWKEFYDYADSEGLNADAYTNTGDRQISNLLVFFKRGEDRKLTNERSGLFIQMSNRQAIYFSDGTTVDETTLKPDGNKWNWDYYIDQGTKQLKSPKK